MTERERWTVYPLLFLSLAIAMRSKITSSLDLHEMTCQTLRSREVEATTLRCREVRIMGEDDSPRLILTAFPPVAGGGGVVQVLSAAGKPEVVLRALPHGGLVELATPKGGLQVVLAVAPAGGGFVETFDSRGEFVRTLAVGLNPLMRGKVGPPPAPATEKPASETAEPQSETPPPSGEPAPEKSPGANDEPTDKPADKPTEKPTDKPADR